MVSLPHFPSLSLYFKLSSFSLTSCSSSFFLPSYSFTQPCLFLHLYALFTYTAAELETKNAFQSYKLLPGRLLYFSDPPCRPNNKAISQYNSQFSITSPQSPESTRSTGQVRDRKVRKFYMYSFPSNFNRNIFLCSIVLSSLQSGLQVIFLRQSRGSTIDTVNWLLNFS